MKKSFKSFVPAMAASFTMAVAVSAQAQTYTLSDFHNFNLSATYANWDADGSQVINGGTGFAPRITSGPTGYEAVAAGNGSGALNFATPPSAAGAEQWQLHFTINPPKPHR